jgi:hypothetical protein
VEVGLRGKQPGVVAALPGKVEFRPQDRGGAPVLAPGDVILLAHDQVRAARRGAARVVADRGGRWEGGGAGALGDHIGSS